MRKTYQNRMYWPNVLYSMWEYARWCGVFMHMLKYPLFYIGFFSVLCLLCLWRVCLYVPCGHLLGKGWPLGSRLWFFVCLFCCFTSQVNSYGHCGTVSSPNHTFSWASLNKQLTSTSCTYFRLLLTTTLLEWFSGREENDRRNYFMINHHESMGPGRDRTRDPWICSQTRICCQTRNRLRYAARCLVCGV